MKRMLIAGALALIAAEQALAADLPQAAPPPPRAPATYVPIAPPVYNWSGFYIGGNGGYGFGSAKDASSTIAGTGTILDGTYTSTGSTSFNGAVAGGQIGANYQINALVLGIEGDFDWSGQKRTDALSCGVGCTINGAAKLPWIATVRGRIGVAADRVLFYGTGGVAWTDVSENITQSGVGALPGTLYNASSTNVGWTAGAGVEVAFAENWTIRAEYLFIQTKATVTGALPVAGATLSDKFTIDDNIVRAGINFKFGP